MDFSLTYMTKWSDLFFAEEAPNGEVVGIGVGKVEGDLLPEKKDWRGHVSVLTIAPEYRRIGYSQRFMKYIEDVSELVYADREFDSRIEITRSLWICSSAWIMRLQCPSTRNCSTPYIDTFLSTMEPERMPTVASAVRLDD